MRRHFELDTLHYANHQRLSRPARLEYLDELAPARRGGLPMRRHFELDTLHFALATPAPTAHLLRDARTAGLCPRTLKSAKTSPPHPLPLSESKFSTFLNPRPLAV
jgi:hypothetical protein